MTKETQKEIKNKNTNRELFLDLNYAGILIFLIIRIPVTNIIGNEGNGYFSIIWEIYNLISLFLGYGVYHIIKKMVRKRNRKNQYHNSTRVFSMSIITAFLLSVIGFIILYLCSGIILSPFTISLGRTGLRLLGVLLIFTSLAGVYRGYFEGSGTTIPTCFSKIVEAVVAGTGAIIFSSILYKHGSKVGELLFNPQYKPSFGALGIVVGCVCGSILSFLFLIIVNTIYQRHLKQLLKSEDSGVIESIGTIFKEFLKLFLITLIELLCFKLFRLVNMYIFINTYSNTDMKAKIVQYIGSYHGKILIITGIIIAIILSVTGKQRKRVEKSYSRNKLALSWRYFCDDMKQLLLLSVPAYFLFMFFSKSILTVLFTSGGTIEVTMLQIGSINILLIPVAVYLYKLLSNLDFKLYITIIPLIALFIQTIVMKTMVIRENIGPLALIISEVVFWLTITVLELLVIIKTLKQPSLKFDDV